MSFQASLGNPSLWSGCWRKLWPYAVTSLGVVAATWVCELLNPVLGGHGVFLFYLLPLIWIGWRYRTGPFVFGTAVSALAGLYVVSGAPHAFGLAPDDWIHLFTFLGVTSAILWLTNRERTLRNAIRENAERLRLSEERFRAIFAAEPVGVGQVALSGTWVSVNSALSRMLGYDEEELVGKTITEVTHPEHRTEDETRLRQVMTGIISSANWEKRYLRKDGSVIWAHVSVAPVRDEGGKVKFVVTVMQDINEVVAAREVLARDKVQLETLVAERTGSLEQTTRHLNFILYTIAHDLRAPLRAQHGYSDLLLTKFGKQLGQIGGEYLLKIKQAAERLDGLVRDVLGYASISRRVLPLNEVRLSQVVELAKAEAAELIRQQKGEIQLLQLEGVVIAHQAGLGTIVVNLLSNALKFARPGVPPVVRVWTELRNRSYRLWVQDNGLGIAPENYEIIFGMFQRLNPGPEYPGTGLGLALVRSGIERMGGKVGVESELGAGSRFWIELPAATGSGFQR